MRKSTKVSIAGKDTTAGEAGGKSDLVKNLLKKKKSGEAGGKSDKAAAGTTDSKGRNVDSQRLFQMLDQKDHYDELRSSFSELLDSDESITYQDVSDAIDDSDAFDSDADKEEAKSQMKGDFNFDDNVDSDDSDDSYDDDDYGDTDDDGFNRNQMADEDKLLNGLDAFRDGLIDKDEWDDIRDEYDEDGEYSDEDGYGEKEEKPAPENDKPWEKSSLGTDKSFKKTPASEKRKYFSFNPVDGGKFTHGKAMPDLVNGLRNSDASNEESIQNLESTLKAAGVYDLKTVDKKDAIKAIEDVDQSVDAKNDMKKHVENIWDKDHQAESVAPRSARIQEAKMYQTIQELKGLEKGL
tara:strand:- start:126 stop:1181 length:1056 start_codon:yes stop_codon:yes gene_type:complete